MLKQFTVLVPLLAILIVSCTMAQPSIGVGDKAPAFSLLNQHGKTITSAEIYGKNLVVLYFYPKDDTPGCTKEACGFRDGFQAFTDSGAVVIGVSADSPSSHKKFAEKYNLPFILLSDEKNELRKAFGVKGNFLGLLPGRVTYIIDKNGVVRHMFESQFEASKHVEEAKRVVSELLKE